MGFIQIPKTRSEGSFEGTKRESKSQRETQKGPELVQNRDQETGRDPGGTQEGPRREGPRRDLVDKT